MGEEFCSQNWYSCCLVGGCCATASYKNSLISTTSLPSSLLSTIKVTKHITQQSIIMPREKAATKAKPEASTASNTGKGKATPKAKAGPKDKAPAKGKAAARGKAASKGSALD